MHVRGSVRAVAMVVSLLGPFSAPSRAEAPYSYPQLRLAREIAAATNLAELCGARISNQAVQAALRSEGLLRQDMDGHTAFRDEMAKQTIALTEARRGMRMAGTSEAEVLRRSCVTMERGYGPRGVARAGFVILPRY